MTEDFRLGFVEGCLEAKCNAEETEELFKVAYVAQMFDANKEFQEGFNKVASDFNTDKILTVLKFSAVMTFYNSDKISTVI